MPPPNPTPKGKPDIILTICDTIGNDKELQTNTSNYNLMDFLQNYNRIYLRTIEFLKNVQETSTSREFKLL